jgi:hypothetical protein
VSIGAFYSAWSSITRAIHGSWLNMAEIEIAILERNALSRRLEDEAALRAPACWRWKPSVTSSGAVFGFQFTSCGARGILEQLYPVKEPSSD